MVLVDSSAWIESLRRNGDMRVKLAVEGLLEAYEAQWCSPVRLEVLGGARIEERARLGRHFSVIPYRPSREDDWDRAVALAWRLRGMGLTVPWLDVLIAAIAIHDGTRLYATDAHFREIARHTGLLLYRPGYGGSFNDHDDG
ncbi:MAG: PIN domain-containing protein [Verrucomicrobiaceae bacterium]|nr:MAG: PIN domain-containing protein [Verrucomicrobiaceae bacterium]